MFIFELDWTLIDRSSRLKDLKNLEQSQSQVHMNPVFI